MNHELELDEHGPFKATTSNRLQQWFLTCGPRTPKGSVDRFQAVRELGGKKLQLYFH
jgi:hypothetical protein